MEKSPLYRLEVAPLVILPLGRSPFFSYASSFPVTPGSVVSISFGRQEVKGVVFDCQVLPGKKPTWMKVISRVLFENFLTEKQCHLAEEISTEYFTSLGRTLVHFLPKVVKARKKEISHENDRPVFRPDKKETLLLKKFNFKENTQPFYLDTSTLSDTKHFYAVIAKKFFPKAQTLILVPEITLITGLEDTFKNIFPEKSIAVLHSLLADGPFYDAWERIRTGEASVIIATRQGLFAPYKNLAAVILTEEQDESYKQWDMSPRYHSKRAAEMLALLHHAKLLFASNTPSVESYFHVKQKNYAALEPLPSHEPLKESVELINLRLERYRKNYSPFSEALINALRKNIAEKKQALIYINRQGMNIFSVCENCKNVFRCKVCGHTLTNTKEGYFRCLHCSYKTGLFPNCPTCGHLSFKHIGFGTEKIEKEAFRLFPGARIERLDSTILRKGNTLETFYKKGMSGKIDILVGTQMILKDPPLPKLSLVAMIDADSLLFFPDFKADERLFQHLSRAALQTAPKDKKIRRVQRVFVETFHPESPFFQKATELKSNEFIEKVLEERKDLLYPPFARLIALTVPEKTQEVSQKKSTHIYEKLKEILPKSFRIHPPQTSQFLKRKNLFESTLLIRIPHTDVLPKKCRDYLLSISKECIIDVDPVTLR